MIYGPNASGKTNILKALDLLRDMVIKPFDTKDKKFEYEPFLFDTDTPDKPTELELEFFQQGIKYIYNIQFNKEAILNEKLYFFNPNRALIYKRVTEIDKQLSKIVFGSKIKISKTDEKILEGNTLWNNTVLGGFQKTNLELELLKIISDWFKIKLNKQIEPRFPAEILTEHFLNENKIDKKNILKILSNANIPIEDFEIEEEQIGVGFPIKGLIDPEIFKKFKTRNISVKNGKIFKIKKLTTHKINNKSYKLNFEEESDGSQRFFGLSGFLLNVLRNNLILSVDELESSLHPDLVKHFLLTFLANSEEAQLIATTHMRELLMEKDILRHDIIWFTERKEDQSTDLYSLADFDTSVIRKANSIYNFYKAGRLGAVPNLGSYYLNLNNGKEKKK